jgi:hypothetical protein
MVRQMRFSCTDARRGAAVAGAVPPEAGGTDDGRHTAAARAAAAAGASAHRSTCRRICAGRDNPADSSRIGASMSWVADAVQGAGQSACGAGVTRAWRHWRTGGQRRGAVLVRARAGGDGLRSHRARHRLARPATCQLVADGRARVGYPALHRLSGEQTGGGRQTHRGSGSVAGRRDHHVRRRAGRAGAHRLQQRLADHSGKHEKRALPLLELSGVGRALRLCRHLRVRRAARVVVRAGRARARARRLSHRDCPPACRGDTAGVSRLSWRSRTSVSTRTRAGTCSLEAAGG